MCVLAYSTPVCDHVALLSPEVCLSWITVLQGAMATFKVREGRGGEGRGGEERGWERGREGRGGRGEEGRFGRERRKEGSGKEFW